MKRYAKSLLLAGITVILATLVFAGLSVHRQSREISIVNDRGTRLANFFTGLPANAAIAKLAATAHIALPACATKPSLTSRIEVLLGITPVVHAQTECPVGGENNCLTYLTTQSYSCGGSCGSGSYVGAVGQTDNANVGTNNDGSFGCGMEACTCNQQVCVLT
jgi:hypothetical protein